MTLNDAQQVSYLSNVIAIAMADSSLSPKETAAIDEVRGCLGAKKAILSAAMKLVQAGPHTVSKVGDFATQVSNLSDMLYLCYVDGELGETEKKLVVELCRSIGLTQAQLDVMVKEAIARCSATKAVVVCPSCSTKVSDDSRFCPKCGKQLANVEQPPVSTEANISSTGYTIQFCESTAASFTSALELARHADSFSSCVVNKKTWYVASWRERSLEAAVELASALSSIRNKKAYHNGQEIAWDELFGFVPCAIGRKAAYRPIEYCFGKDQNRINPWGCRQVGMDWTEWARWFSYGTFKRTGMLKKSWAWQFDKDRIRHDAMTNLHRCRYCPHIRTALVEAVLAAIPDEVEITPNGAWKFSHAFEEVPGSIKVVETEKVGDFEYRSEYFADGVRPRGLQSLADVLRQALSAAGISDLTVADLLK